LFQRFAKLDEGDLSRVRANLVKQQSLFEIAQAINVSEALRLGEGELRSGGFRRPSILADTLEAIFGAVFLDGGFDAAQTVIKRLYVPILDHIDPCTLGKDAKTLLQEYLQGHKIALPNYAVIATTGAAHNQQFEVECSVPKLEIKVFGTGASRRSAEQAAAKKALDEILTVAPQTLGKPKRSKSAARAAKRHADEALPDGTGVQGALDLRPAERKSERQGGRIERGPRSDRDGLATATAGSVVPPLAVAMMRASHTDHYADRATERPLEKAADKLVTEPVLAANGGASATASAGASASVASTHAMSAGAVDAQLADVAARAVDRAVGKGAEQGTEKLVETVAERSADAGT
jgi:ribonuclease-3